MARKASQSENPGAPTPAPVRRFENLALAYQDALTVIVRLRANRQHVENAEAFRANIRGLLKKAAQEAGERGYTGEDSRVATFAVVALLDETVLSLGNPVFHDWQRAPLAVELYGMGVAGEIFFSSLDRLLARKDSATLADLLEVYYLCLLLGFGGRYGRGGSADLRSYTSRVGERIRQIRGVSLPLSPSWAPDAGSMVVRRADPWTRRLAFGVGACLLLALVLFGGFRFSLGSGVSELITMSSPGGSVVSPK
jgi:type VI secretion system protein ImpK